VCNDASTRLFRLDKVDTIVHEVYQEENLHPVRTYCNSLMCGVVMQGRPRQNSLSQEMARSPSGRFIGDTIMQRNDSKSQVQLPPGRKHPNDPPLSPSFSETMFKRRGSDAGDMDFLLATAQRELALERARVEELRFALSKTIEEAQAEKDAAIGELMSRNQGEAERIASEFEATMAQRAHEHAERVTSLEQHIQQLMGTVQSIEREKDTVVSTVDQKDKQIADLTLALEQERMSLDARVQEAMNAEKGTTERLKRDIVQLHNEVETLSMQKERQRVDYTDIISRVESEHEETQMQLMQMRDIMEQERERAKNEVDLVIQEMDTLRLQLAQSNDKANGFKNQLTAANKRADAKEAEVGVLTQSLAAKEEQVKRVQAMVEQEVKAHADTRQAMERDMQALEARHEERMQADKLAQQALATAISGLEAMVEEHKVRHAASETSLKQLGDEKAALSAQLTTVQSDLDKLGAELEAEKATSAAREKDLRAQMDVLAGERDAARSGLDKHQQEAQHERTRHEETVQQLQADMASVAATLETTRLEHAEREHRFKQQQQHIVQERDQLQLALKDERESSQAAMSMLEARLAALDKQVAEKQALVDVATADRDADRQRLEQLAIELNNTKDTVAKMTAERDALRTTNASHVRKVDSLESELRKLTEDKAQDITRLEFTINDHVRKIKLTETELDTARKSLAELRKENAERVTLNENLHIQLRTKDSEIETLKLSTVEKDRRIASVGQKSKEYETRAQELQTSHDQLVSSGKKLEAQLEKRVKEHHKLKETLAKQEAESNGLSKQLKDANDAKTTLSKSLEEAKARDDKHTKQIHEMDMENARLRDESKKAYELLEHSESGLGEIVAERDRLLIEKDRYDTLVASLEAQVVSGKSEVEQVFGRLEEANERVRQLDEQHQAMTTLHQGDKEHYEQQMERLKSELEAEQMRVQQLQYEHTSTASKLLDQSDEVSQLNQHVQHLEAQLQKQQEAMDALTMANDTINNHKSDLEVKYNQLGADYAHLQEDLKDAMDKAERVKGELEEAQATVDKTNVELVEKAKEVERLQAFMQGELTEIHTKEVANLTRAHDQMQEQLKAVMQEKQAVDRKFDDAQHVLADLRLEMARIQAHSSVQADSLLSTEMLLTQEQNQVMRQSMMLKQYEQDMAQMKMDIAQSTKELVELRASLVEEREQRARELESSWSEQEQIRVQVQKEHATLIQERDRLTTRVQSLTTKLGATAKDKKRLQQELDDLKERKSLASYGIEDLEELRQAHYEALLTEHFRVREKLASSQEQLARLLTVADERDAWRSSTKRLERTVIALEAALGGRLEGAIPTTRVAFSGAAIPIYQDCCQRCRDQPLITI
jgi:chromosome segregation ATPase